MRRRMVVPVELKCAALERMRSGEAASAIAAGLGVGRQRLYAWRAAVRKGGQAALRGPGRPRGAADEAFLSPYDLPLLVDPRRGERPGGPC